jgi:hypothetical protein
VLKFVARKIAADNSGGKELIMAINNSSNMNPKSVMGFSYYSYFKACFFAGLFCRTQFNLSGA